MTPVVAPSLELSLTPPSRAGLAAVPSVAWILRAGAWASGVLFGTSLLLGLLPRSAARQAVATGCCRAGVSLLLATPGVALAGAGVWFLLRREYRYAALAGGVLLLLAFALKLS